MTKEIPLTQGKIAIVDDEDFELVIQYKWRSHKGRNTFYARSDKVGYLHKFIMSPDQGMQIDHRDGNGLNCIRSNLRIATCSQNATNAGVRKNNTSGYKGVHFKKNEGKYEAYITYNGKRIGLGLYEDSRDAAHAYDHAAREYFGEFSKTNF